MFTKITNIPTQFYSANRRLARPNDDHKISLQLMSTSLIGTLNQFENEHIL